VRLMAIGRSSTRVLAGALVVAASVMSAAQARAGVAASLPDGFYDQIVTGDLDRPVGMAFLPDGRLLVIENDTGRVRLVVDGKFGAVDPMGTLTGLQALGEEEGLMGIAVDPEWPDRPYLYFHHAGTDTSLHIVRYAVQGDLTESTSGFLMLDHDSKYQVMSGIPNNNDFHDGGTLRFGPDGMLYASLGDDAVACTAIDTTSLSGVIIRIDVSNLPDGPGGPPDRADLVPPDNPFVASPNVNERLVYAMGLRNPFRFHVDPANGALFVADVGQHRFEEIDWFPVGGSHAGWPYYEGSGTFVTTQCGPPAPGALMSPIAIYDRPSDETASVISAGVYRPVGCTNCNFPAEYEGDYFFSDFYTGFLRRLKYTDGVWSYAPPVSGQPNATDWATGLRFVSDYLIGPDGALWYCRWADSYVIPNSGEIRRIYYQQTPAAVEARTVAGVSFDAPYPSPARGGARFSYALSRDADVRLELFDLAGRAVRRFVPARQGAGSHAIAWDGRTDQGLAAPAGVYVARLSAGGTVLTQRFPMVR
jgi:glucose/arabinose dehydrogenase